MVSRTQACTFVACAGGEHADCREHRMCIDGGVVLERRHLRTRACGRRWYRSGSHPAHFEYWCICTWQLWLIVEEDACSAAEGRAWHRRVAKHCIRRNMCTRHIIIICVVAFGYASRHWCCTQLAHVIRHDRSLSVRGTGGCMLCGDWQA